MENFLLQGTTWLMADGKMGVFTGGQNKRKLYFRVRSLSAYPQSCIDKGFMAAYFYTCSFS
jgi:hypothetical protein